MFGYFMFFGGAGNGHFKHHGDASPKFIFSEFFARLQY